MNSLFDSTDIVRGPLESLHHLLGEQYVDCLEALPIDVAPNRLPLFDVLTYRQKYEQRPQAWLLLDGGA